ncbi:MAG: hypothetical protein JKX73_11850, partial [Flavobacteriales bacterium]|nr:hypothetical protein [Flavobacteriales bacterium]
MKPVLVKVLRLSIWQKVVLGILVIMATAPSIHTYGQECGYVYVTPGGAGSGFAGTKATPANLAYGLTLTSGTDDIVRLSSGTYNLSSEFMMISNITLEGGFD